MKFKNYEERMQHPQARLIPERLLRDFFSAWNIENAFFYRDGKEFPDALISLIQNIQNNPNSLFNYLEKNQITLKKHKKKVGLIIALSYQSLDPNLVYEIKKLLDMTDEVFFSLCADVGNASLMDVCASNHEPEWVRGVIEAGYYSIFREAAANGNLSVLHYLSEKAPDELQDMIVAYNYYAFTKAAEGGHLHVLKYLAEKAPAKLRHMIAADNYRAFTAAAANGHLSVLQYLGDQVPDKLQDMISENNYRAFSDAAANGHVSVLQYFAEQAPSHLQKMIIRNQYSAFSQAAINGHVSVLRYLGEHVDDKEAMITADNYNAFQQAIYKGHLHVLQYFEEQAPEKLREMVIANNYEAFRNASSWGYLSILHYLAGLVPDKIEEMIAAYDYMSFRLAANCHYTEVVQFLLSKPYAFAFVESHQHEFDEYTLPFIQECLSELREMKADYGDQSIPVALDKAKQLFYVARALIRRQASLEELCLILDIPQVRELAHQIITPGQPNELLRLAARLNNQEICDYLLTIPSIYQEAQANNFYIDEYLGDPNLRLMAQDRESSMTALSEEENQRLETLKAHYMKEEKRSSNEILDEFRTLLITRYEEYPARIMVADLTGDMNCLSLPWAWDKFLSIPFAEEERQAALEAYYKNKNHTAWRFLAKPNHWMHPEAGYINRNAFGAWSCFEEYLDLIVVLFLAATDKSIPGVDDYTVDDRVTQFIDELAHIGRAHNWDETNQKREEYDDLSGDRPSCYSGTKRRLFQSVQGHPLLRQLTSDILQLELREFVWHHFQTAITENNYTTICNVWQKSIDLEELTSEEKRILSEINIPKDDQTAWLERLHMKYGEQTKYHQIFLQQKFNLPDQENHFIRFGYLGLDQLLRSLPFQKKDSEMLRESTQKSSSEETTSVQFFKPWRRTTTNNLSEDIEATPMDSHL